MKKELLQAYEHLLVIRGTHYGLLAEEELRLVCQRYGLDEDDEGRLREMLAIPRQTIGYEALLDLAGQLPPEPDPEPHRQLQQLLRMDRPASLLYAWVEQFKNDDDATRILTDIREGASVAQIAAELGQSEEEVLRTERRLVHTFRRTYRDYRLAQTRRHRRRPISEFYN